MITLQQLKMLKRKLLYISLIIIVILGVAGISGFVQYRFEKRNDGHNFNSYQTLYDLLYLENTANTKISAKQARALLPQIIKLQKSNKKARIQLIKNIYEQLTPEQYYAILTADRKLYPGRSVEKWGELKREFSHKWGHDTKNENIRNEILRDIVVKMLEDISSK